MSPRGKAITNRTSKAAILRLNRSLNRLELATALEISGTEEELRLAKLLRSDGDSSRMHVSTLAAAVGVSFRRVVECYRDLKRLEGIAAVAERLPTVLDGIATDAESKEVTCAQCEGEGSVTITKNDQPVVKPCIPCEGTGRVTRSGDPVARKQVLEMMELAGKVTPLWAPGSNIVMSGESLEDTLRRVAQRKEQQSNGTDRTAPTIEADERASGTNSTGNGADTAS